MPDRPPGSTPARRSSSSVPARPAALPAAVRVAEERSLDLVQRAIVSALLGVVLGAAAGTLALYLVLAGPTDLARSDVLGLWVMVGVVGLGTAVAILLVNRRRPYAPWVLLGLAPMAVSGWWILGLAGG